METTMKNLTTVEMLKLLENEPTGKAEHRPEMSAMEALNASVTAVQEVSDYAEKLFGAMSEILELLNMIRDTSDISDIESDIAGMTWKQVYDRLDKAIDARRASANHSVRRAMYLQFLLRWVQELSDTGEGTATFRLDIAVEDKILQPNDKANFRFRGQNYQISGELGFTENDMKQLEPLFAELCKKAKNAKPKEIKQQSSATPVTPKTNLANQRITVGRAWRGELGKFELVIPPNGNDKGGVLQMKHQEGGFLFIVQATNGLSDLESQCINLFAIKDEKGNVRNGLKLVPPQGIYSEHLARWQSQMERLGNVLKRGFRPIIEGEKNMDPHRWLTTDAIGDSVLTFEGNFIWDPPQGISAVIFDLTLRFRRQDDGQVALTEILGNPDDLVNASAIFSEALGKYQNPGHAFQNMKPQQCRVFLRAVYGQVVRGRDYEEAGH